MSEQATIFVVDDDQAVRESLAWLIGSVHLNVKTFASAREFLDHFNPDLPGCLLLDVRMPGMSGLDLQEKLWTEQIPLPVIFISGHGDVPMAVRAMKRGALDFVEKPFNDQKILDLIQQALELDAQIRATRSHRDTLQERVSSLSRREREVMDLVAAGRVNKEIADELNISIKTVETHRAKVMSKMAARSVAELVHMVLLHERIQERHR